SASRLLSPPTPAAVASPLSLHDALPIFLADDTANIIGAENFRRQLNTGRRRPIAIIHHQQVVVVILQHGINVARACRCRSAASRSEEHTSELQSRENLVCRLLLEKKKDN